MDEVMDINKLNEDQLHKAILDGRIRLEDYTDSDVMQCLIALRAEVHNINRTMSNVLAREKITSGEMIPYAYFEGIYYGIAIKDLGEGILEERIYAKPDNALWAEMSNTDKLGIIGSILAVFMDRGYTDHRIEVAQNCFIFSQKFQIAYLYQRSPGLVSISGGVLLDKEGKVIH